MELSMVIAIIASLALYQFLPAIVITFFALLSEFVEGFIVQKGRKNIQLLYDLAPRKAIIETNNNNQNGGEANLITTTQEVLVDKVRVGDVVIVREGDIIPVDGHILRSASTVNQSSITGESAPITSGESVPNTTGAPTTGNHKMGELFVDNTGSLYFCILDGTPGTWKKVQLV
jgi:cation transport ATPase